MSHLRTGAPGTQVKNHHHVCLKFIDHLTTNEHNLNRLQTKMGDKMPRTPTLSALHSLTCPKCEPSMCQARRTWQLKRKPGTSFTAPTKPEIQRRGITQVSQQGAASAPQRNAGLWWVQTTEELVQGLGKCPLSKWYSS